MFPNAMVLADISYPVIRWKSHPSQSERPTVSAVEKAVNVTAPLDTVMKDEECAGALEAMRTLGESDHNQGELYNRLQGEIDQISKDS